MMAAPAADRYVTATALKSTLQLTGQTYADSDIATAISAASRGLENAYNSTWTLGQVGENRYYTPDGYTVQLGDLLAASAVHVDLGWAGSYSTSLTASTQYRLLPATNGLIANGGNGEPYDELQIVRGYGGSLGCGRDSVKITGQFGWEAIPAGVEAAVTIIATRLLRRTREAPFGIIAIGVEGSAIRAGQIANDPEVAFVMDPLSSSRRFFA